VALILRSVGEETVRARELLARFDHLEPDAKPGGIPALIGIRGRSKSQISHML
jgi:hypothetical protein